MSASPKDTKVEGDPAANDVSAIDASMPFILGEWRIDPVGRTASRGDEVVKIDPRNMRVLQILVERHGQIVSQRELEALAWEGVVVTPDSLYQSIRQLRQALRDTKTPPKYIETVPRRGYRMRIEACQASGPPHEPSSPSLQAGHRTGRESAPFHRSIRVVLHSRLAVAFLFILLVSGVFVQYPYRGRTLVMTSFQQPSIPQEE
jgi:DNA-binding winged helix-turn-helix (wHTH) protein